MATDSSPRFSPLGGRFRLRDTTTKEFYSTQVTAGADLGIGHSPSEILNRNERLFSAFSLFSLQGIWLKDSK